MFLSPTVLMLKAHRIFINFFLSFYLAIYFEYKKRPLNWDGLSFVVDRQVVMAKTSHTTNFVTVTYPLSFGAHVLEWIYSKDATLTKGEDAAFISVRFISYYNSTTPFPLIMPLYYT